MKKLSLSFKLPTDVELSGTAWYSSASILMRMNSPYNETLSTVNMHPHSRILFCDSQETPQRIDSCKRVFADKLLEKSLVEHAENRTTILKEQIAESLRWNHVGNAVVPKLAANCREKFFNLKEFEAKLKLIGEEINFYKENHSRSQFRRWYSENGDSYRIKRHGVKNDIVETEYDVRSMIRDALEHTFYRLCTVSEIDRAESMVYDFLSIKKALPTNHPKVSTQEVLLFNDDIVIGKVVYSAYECQIFVEESGMKEIYREQLTNSRYLPIIYEISGDSSKNRVTIDPVQTAKNYIDFFSTNKADIIKLLEDEHEWWNRFRMHLCPDFSKEYDQTISDWEEYADEIKTVQRRASTNALFNRLERFTIHPAVQEWRETELASLTMKRDFAYHEIVTRMADLIESNGQKIKDSTVHHAIRVLTEFRSNTSKESQ